MLKINKIYDDAYAREFTQDFLGNSELPRYIYGVNETARLVIGLCKVDGIIANKVDGNNFHGVPVVTLNDIEDNALVLQVIRGMPITEEQKMSAYQFRSLDLFSFIRYANNNDLEIDFWQGFKEDFEKNRSKYDAIYDRLGDRISKDIFYNLINFRVSHDLRYMRSYIMNHKEQYFADVYEFEKDEVFLDIGGFDGDTAIEFVKRCPDYKKVFFFEPEKGNISKAKQLLANYNNIEFIEFGLSNKKEKLSFDVSGPQSRIFEGGTNTIEVAPLNTLIDEKFSFMKMDIEGLEYEALEGGLDLIKKYHPKIALAVYHKANDFWRLPELIFSVRNDYNIYLRHYTEGIFDTVMYFIPQK
jgi:FkbM family methyltransferase